MNRWVVRKHPSAGTWSVYHVSSDNAGSGVLWTRVSHWLDTWREAMDYADRLSRTREYVLPRPDKNGDIATTDEQTAWEGTEFERTVVSVAWIEEPGTIGLSTGDSDHYMSIDGARSIGLALLALAEKEEQP